MHKTAVTVSNRKTLLYMQNVTSWQNFSAQTHRFEHHHETNAPSHMPDSGNKVRLTMMVNFLMHLSGLAEA